MIKSVHAPKYQALIRFLKSERLRRGYTTRDLAVLLNEPHQFVSKVETGQRRLNVYEYVQYCRALQISPTRGLRVLY